MRQGDGSEFLHAGDPRSAEIGIVHVEAMDSRQEILTAINLFNMQGRKQIVLDLSEPRKVFRESVDFDGLKRAKRDMRARLIVIAPSGSNEADFARSHGFPVYSSLDNLQQALADESSESTLHTQDSATKRPGLLAFGSRKANSSGRARPTTMNRDARRGGPGGPDARSFPQVPPTPQQQGSPLSPLPPTAPTPRTFNQPGAGGAPDARAGATFKGAGDARSAIPGVPPTPRLGEPTPLVPPPPTPRLAEQAYTMSSDPRANQGNQPPMSSDPRANQGNVNSPVNTRKEPPSTQDDDALGAPLPIPFPMPDARPSAPRQEFGGVRPGDPSATNAPAPRAQFDDPSATLLDADQQQMGELPPTPVKRPRKDASKPPLENRQGPDAIIFPGSGKLPAAPMQPQQPPALPDQPTRTMPSASQQTNVAPGQPTRTMPSAQQGPGASGTLPAVPDQPTRNMPNAQSGQPPRNIPRGIWSPRAGMPADQFPEAPPRAQNVPADAGNPPDQSQRGNGGKIAAAGALGAAALAAGAAFAGEHHPGQPPYAQNAPTGSGTLPAAPGQPPRNAPNASQPNAAPGQPPRNVPNAQQGPDARSGQLPYNMPGSQQMNPPYAPDARAGAPGNAPDQSQRGGSGKIAAAGALGAAALAASAASAGPGKPGQPPNGPGQPPRNMPNAQQPANFAPGQSPQRNMPGAPQAPTGTGKMAAAGALGAAGAMGRPPNGPAGPVPTARQTALTPLPSPIEARRRRQMWRRSLLVLLALLLIGVLIAALVPRGPLSGIIAGHVTANVTITPLSKLETNNYLINGIPDGSNNLANHQVAARNLTSTSPTQTATGNATGSIQATTAHGTLTLQNTTGAGVTLSTTTLTSKSGVQIKFDGPVFVPGLGSTRVTAYAINAGAAGNIPAVDFSGSCCASGIFANNPSAFTGGQDAVTNSVIQQSDIDGAVNPLVGTLTTSTKADLQRQVKANEHVVDSSLLCTPASNADQKPGDQVKQVHVSVSVTCKQEVYDFAGAQQMAVQLLQAQAMSDPNLTPPGQYTLDGQIVPNLVSANLVNANGQVALNVQAQGLWVYQFTPQIQQNLKGKLVKLPLQGALGVLHAWPGVSQSKDAVKIDISSGTTMPANANDITLVVQKLPGATGTPTSGTPGGSNGTPAPGTPGSGTPGGSNGTPPPGAGPGTGTPGGSSAPGPGTPGSPGKPGGSNAPGPGRGVTPTVVRGLGGS